MKQSIALIITTIILLVACLCLCLPALLQAGSGRPACSDCAGRQVCGPGRPACSDCAGRQACTSRQETQAPPLLTNGGFEMDWGVDASHRCLIFPPNSEPYETDIGNIFTPTGWLTWFRHDPGLWDQPEARDTWATHFPYRVHSGEKAILLFTFNRRHDAGFLQQVQVEPGQQLRLTAWAHAWSNHSLAGYEWCADDGRCSCGVGREIIAIPADEIPLLNGDPWNDAVGNVLFAVGIDPTGGTDPYADTVEWSEAWAIYNGYAHQLSVEAVAQADTVTVFLRSITLWPFKHNDVYWDDVILQDAPYKVFLPTVAKTTTSITEKIREWIERIQRRLE